MSMLNLLSSILMKTNVILLSVSTQLGIWPALCFLLLYATFLAFLFLVFKFLSKFLQIVDSIISHGSFLTNCFIEHSVVGIRSRINSDVQLKVCHYGLSLVLEKPAKWHEWSCWGFSFSFPSKMFNTSVGYTKQMRVKFISWNQT